MAFDDGAARVWRTDYAEAPLVLPGHEESVLRAQFSPDSSLVVTTSSDRTARVWRLDRQAEPVVSRGHQGRVWTAAISHDSRRVLTSSDDGTARVWRVEWRSLLLYLGVVLDK
ncbi:MAG: hypothetical protein IPK33_17065 [Gemmatimonadetes bacterium]|nr:hypothetical protein [Gemmatimonadota bacterium]